MTLKLSLPIARAPLILMCQLHCLGVVGNGTVMIVVSSIDDAAAEVARWASWVQLDDLVIVGDSAVEFAQLKKDSARK